MNVKLKIDGHPVTVSLSDMASPSRAFVWIGVTPPIKLQSCSFGEENLGQGIFLELNAFERRDLVKALGGRLIEDIPETTERA